MARRRAPRRETPCSSARTSSASTSRSPARSTVDRRRVARGCAAGRSSTSSTSTCRTSRSRCPRTDGGHVVATRTRTRVTRAAGGLGLGGVDHRADRGPDRRLRVRVHLPRGRGLQRQGGRPDPPPVARADRPLVAPDRRVERSTRADHVGRTSGYARGGAGLEQRAQPGADLGAGRDAGGQQRLPEREAARSSSPAPPTAARRSRSCPTARSTSAPSWSTDRPGPPRARLVRRRPDARRQPPDLVGVLRVGPADRDRHDPAWARRPRRGRRPDAARDADRAIAGAIEPVRSSNSRRVMPFWRSVARSSDSDA